MRERGETGIMHKHSRGRQLPREKANIELGKNISLPYPIVDHAYARQRALNAYKVIE